MARDARRWQDEAVTRESPEPLTAKELEAFRARIVETLAEVDDAIAASAEATAVVTLDQAAVGRVSRGDALQAQAMAQAAVRNLERRKTELEHALARWEAREYGDCNDCGDPIGWRRLRIQPEARFCVGYKSDRETAC